VAYELDEHRHRFSVWAAARATQRGLCDVVTLREALEKCGVVAFLRSADLGAVGASEFDRRHREWCRSIVHFLKGRGLADASFGHAAKLLGMYLKSMVVLGSASETAFAHVAHPPIDGILLSAISSSPEIECGHRHAWAKIKWTQLDEAAYYRLVGELRSCVGANQPFWKLERFWTVTRTKDPNFAVHRAGARVARSGR
jgi:hypothetical protein